jgi:uncharacterized protein YcnI
MSVRVRIFILVLITIIMATSEIASAHVVVKPSQVGIASFQVFTVNVPTEKSVPTVALRLVIPNGLEEVTPTVKEDWQITTKKSGDQATEIDWSGGSIPPNLRDDFTFSAQVPADPTELRWKVYQTYSDGSVVSWDATPNGSDDATNAKGPYSTTRVENDLITPSSSTKSHDTMAYVLSGIAIVLSVISLATSKFIAGSSSKQ